MLYCTIKNFTLSFKINILSLSLKHSLKFYLHIGIKIPFFICAFNYRKSIPFAKKPNQYHIYFYSSASFKNKNYVNSSCKSLILNSFTKWKTYLGILFTVQCAIFKSWYSINRWNICTFKIINQNKTFWISMGKNLKSTSFINSVYSYSSTKFRSVSKKTVYFE